MDIKKIKRGDRLQVALTEMNVGDSIKVPYRCYSENSIRSTISQLKQDSTVAFDVNTRSNVAAIITRVS